MLLQDSEEVVVSGDDEGAVDKALQLLQARREHLEAEDTQR